MITKWEVSYFSLSLTAYLHLKFSDSSLKSQKLLLKSGLLSFQGCDLLLDSAVLCFLKIKMSLHFLFDSDQLIGKTFLDISSFHCKD